VVDGDLLGRRQWLKQAAAAGMGVATTHLATDHSAFAQQPAEAPQRVPRRMLGRTGQTVPVLLMGGAQVFDPVYDEKLHRAFELGIDFVETAKSYRSGRSHRTLKPFIEQVGRKNLWITSQSGMFGMDGPAPVAMYRDAIMPEYEVLGTDYLDAYMFLGAKHLEILEPEYLAFADELRASGRTRYFGISCHDLSTVDMMNKAARLGSDAINLITFVYSFRNFGDLELNRAMDACVAAGIGLIGIKTQSSMPVDSPLVQRFQSEGLNLHQARLRAAVEDERLSACISGLYSLQILNENAQAVLGAKGLTA
jgi:predicted aldo/keto reductase-like oxidoreductase